MEQQTRVEGIEDRTDWKSTDNNYEAVTFCVGDGIDPNKVDWATLQAESGAIKCEINTLTRSEDEPNSLDNEEMWREFTEIAKEIATDKVEFGIVNTYSTNQYDYVNYGFKSNIDHIDEFVDVVFRTVEKLFQKLKEERGKKMDKNKEITEKDAEEAMETILEKFREKVEESEEFEELLVD